MPVETSGLLDLVVRNATVVTMPPGAGPRRGPAMSDLRVLPAQDVGIIADRVRYIGPTGSAPPAYGELDARGRVLTPGLVDCHTHALWAGSRVEEWLLRARGASYGEIRDAGGGILSTVRAVREASDDTLLHLLLERLERQRMLGTLITEVKSGYGLRGEEELRLLRTIGEARRRSRMTVRATAFLGHAIDPDIPDFVERIIHETLPEVTTAFPGIPVDAYVDDGAWTLEDAVRLFRRARELGHPIRVHADQFRSLGMVEAAIELGAVSVDHLEASTPETLRRLAASTTIGVLLPLSGFHLDGRYADGRRLIDAGGAVAVASNWNPGTGPSPDLRLAMRFAVRHCGLSVAEAICATTVNAASVLGLPGEGVIDVGGPSRLVLWETDDMRELVHDMSGMIGNRVISTVESMRAAWDVGADAC